MASGTRAVERSQGFIRRHLSVQEVVFGEFMLFAVNKSQCNAYKNSESTPFYTHKLLRRKGFTREYAYKNSESAPFYTHKQLRRKGFTREYAYKSSESAPFYTHKLFWRKGFMREMRIKTARMHCFIRITLSAEGFTRKRDHHHTDSIRYRQYEEAEATGGNQLS